MYLNLEQRMKRSKILLKTIFFNNIIKETKLYFDFFINI